MSKESLDYQKLCSNYYSSWEEGCCMESCEFYNHNECSVVYVNGLIADLEAKLAEKDKEIEKWKSMAERSSSILDRFNYCGESIVYNTTREQDKISFALEQLEKVKELVEEKSMTQSPFGTQKIYASDVSAIVDSQIEELKKEMK